MNLRFQLQTREQWFNMSKQKMLVFSMVVLLCLGVVVERSWLSAKRNSLPCYNEVMKVIMPLRYSGVEMFFRPEVTLNIVFEKELWALSNTHHFASDGSFVLEGGRYGLCSELAAHTFVLLKPVFGDEYILRFVRVAESHYFFKPGTSHIIIALRSRYAPEPPTYVIDPSFHVYARLDKTDNYMVQDTADALPFVKNHSKESVFPVDSGTPVYIRKGYLIDLMVEKVNGMFDPANFAIALLATRHNTFLGRHIISFRNNNGVAELIEDKTLAGRMLTKKQYQLIRAQMQGWFEMVRAGKV